MAQSMGSPGQQGSVPAKEGVMVSLKAIGVLFHLENPPVMGNNAIMGDGLPNITANIPLCLIGMMHRVCAL